MALSGSDSEVEIEDISPPGKRKITTGVLGYSICSSNDSRQGDNILPAAEGFSDDEMSEKSVVDLDPEPYILFARESRRTVKPTALETSVGKIWKTESYKIFQRPKSESIPTTHSTLLTDPDVAEILNSEIPQEFQGTGYFAVTVDEKVVAQVPDILEILKDDGNRAWSQRSKKWRSFAKRKKVVNVLIVYYSHTHSGFCKTVSFIVDVPQSIEIAVHESNIVLIRYYWSSGNAPTSFDPRQYREPRLPSFYKQKMVTQFGKKSRGPVVAPRHLLKEIVEETPTEIVQLNPSFQISSTRQVKTARQAAKSQQYGRDKLQYLLESKSVESLFYQSVEREKATVKFLKRKLHFISQKYQLDLLAKYGFGRESLCVDIDVKFKLTDAYAIVMTCRLPQIVHKERRTPYVAINMIALTERKDELAFEEVALWLNSQMIKRKVSLLHDDPVMNLKIQTDDELALYRPFIQVFKAVHVLCSNHLSEAYQRSMKKLGSSVDLIHAWLRRLFGDPDRETGTYLKGTVDEESLADMTRHVQSFERAEGNPRVLNWLLESNSGIKKLHSKMGPAVRKLAGVFPNLPHTNVVEGMNNFLGLECGRNGISQCELADRLDNSLRARCEDICRSFMDLGDYKILDERFAIRRTERNDGKVISDKLKLFFGADPDPEKLLSIWKGVRMDEEPASSDQTEMGKLFESSGLGIHHKAAFTNASHYCEHPEKIVTWPGSSDIFKDSDIQRFGVLSESDVRQQYHVFIDAINGRHECMCPWSVKNQKRLCKHIVAAAASSDLLAVVVNYIKSGKGPETLAFETVPGGGKKPSQHVHKTGKGYTVRQSLHHVGPAASGADVVVEDEADPRTEPEFGASLSVSLNSTGTVDNHPQAAYIAALVKSRPSSPEGCVCGCPGGKPWHKGSSPFKITNEPVVSALSCCPGCKTLLKNRIDSALLMVREEFDYQRGTKGKVIILAPHVRKYCLRLQCIRDRHPKFRPEYATLDKNVVFTNQETFDIAAFKARSGTSK